MSRAARPPDPRVRLDRDAPEREPALELGLDRELRADQRLDLELALGGALLLALRRHERVPRAALVVVDEVDRSAGAVLEAEHRAQHALGVAAERQRVG